MKQLARQLESLLATPAFFWGVVGFFILEALWFVFFMAYPMAFDEDFHLGVIRIYAERISPFLGEQPAGADSFGALARDPSYLFHYLMSFPYRLITLFTHSEMATVIILRLLNVAMFVGGLLLFKKVLQRLGTSPALVSTIFAVFVLVPIIPWLAGTINYDNLLFLMLPWIFLLAFKMNDALRKRHFDIKTFFIFIIGCMLLTLVKYAALPILLGITLYLLFTAARSFWKKTELSWTRVVAGFRKVPVRTAIVLGIIFLIVSGLFIERYGINMALYREPAPDCSATLSVERCMQYGPWARDYLLSHNKAVFDTSPVTYMGEWLNGMWTRSFFAVSGPEQDYTTRLGIPVPSFSSIALAIAGAVVVIMQFRRLFRGHALLQLVFVVSVVYIVTLWLKLYGNYLATGQPVAINGRYLLPFLPIFGAIMGRGFSLALRKRRYIKPYAAMATLFLFICGGGVFTFMILAEPTWYW